MFHVPCVASWSCTFERNSASETSCFTWSPEENCSATISSNETQQLMSSNQALKASSGTSSAGTSRLTRLLKHHGPPTPPPGHPPQSQRKKILSHSCHLRKSCFSRPPFWYTNMYNVHIIQIWSPWQAKRFCWHLVFAMYSSRLMLAPFALLPNFFAATWRPVFNMMRP